RLHAQVVDLVEAAALGRKAHQDVHRLVAVDRPVFGRLEAVGDELDGAADGVDAGAVFRRLRLVDLKLPVDAGGGWPSSRSRMSLRAATIAATLLAAAGSAAGSSALSCTWIGLPVGGPARGAVTSIRMPAISAVLARMASMISCAGGRLR